MSLRLFVVILFLAFINIAQSEEQFMRRHLKDLHNKARRVVTNVKNTAKDVHKKVKDFKKEAKRHVKTKIKAAHKKHKENMKKLKKEVHQLIQHKVPKALLGMGFIRDNNRYPLRFRLFSTVLKALAPGTPNLIKFPTKIKKTKYQKKWGMTVPESNLPTKLVLQLAKFATLGTMSSYSMWGQYLKNDHKYAMDFFNKDLRPDPIVDWTSDERTVAFFLDAMGGPTLQLDSEEDYVKTYRADLTSVNWKFTSGYEDFAGMIYLTVDWEGHRKISKINFGGQDFTKEETAPENWEFLKLQMRTAAFTRVTFEHHLINTHFRWSGLGTRAINEAFQEHTQHPLYKMLFIHTHNVETVNGEAVALLIPKKGLLHRSYPMSFDVLKDYYPKTYAKFKYQSTPDELQEQGLDEDSGAYAFSAMTLYPIYFEYCYSIVSDYAGDDTYFDEDPVVQDLWAKLSASWNFDDHMELNVETLSEVLTEFMFRVSWFHHQVGNALPYLFSSKNVASRLEQHKELRAENDKLGFYWLGTLGAATGRAQVKLLQESHGDILEPEHKQYWDQFLATMQEVHETFPSWEVDTYETSVGR